MTFPPWQSLGWSFASRSQKGNKLATHPEQQFGCEWDLGFGGVEMLWIARYVRKNDMKKTQALDLCIICLVFSQLPPKPACGP